MKHVLWDPDPQGKGKHVYGPRASQALWTVPAPPFHAQSVCTCVGGRTEDSTRGRTFPILLTYLGSALVRRHLGVKQLLISTFQRVENGHRHRALGTPLKGKQGASRIILVLSADLLLTHLQDSIKLIEPLKSQIHSCLKFCQQSANQTYPLALKQESSVALGSSWFG